MSADARIWVAILVIGVGTFLIRYSFIGLVGDRALPGWVSRLLRYVPMAVMPGILAPLVLWPQATGGATDPARLLAAAVALAIGAATRSVLGAITGGMGALYLLIWLGL